MIYNYKFKFNKVFSGDNLRGIIDLGFGVQIEKEIFLVGIKSPKPTLEYSIKDIKERYSKRDKGLKAKGRLKEILEYGSRQPEGLYIDTLLKNTKSGGAKIVFADIKYVYARDIHNYNFNSKPWTGWTSVSQKLLEENLVSEYNSQYNKL